MGWMGHGRERVARESDAFFGVLGANRTGEGAVRQGCDVGGVRGTLTKRYGELKAMTVGPKRAVSPAIDTAQGMLSPRCCSPSEATLGHLIPISPPLVTSLEGRFFRAKRERLQECLLHLSVWRSQPSQSPCQLEPTPGFSCLICRELYGPAQQFCGVLVQSPFGRHVIVSETNCQADFGLGILLQVSRVVQQLGMDLRE